MLRKSFPYILGFVLLAFFCCIEYGPVVRHLAEENYFSFEELPMTYVLSLPCGKLYWVGRFLMLPFQWQWVGGLYLAALLSLGAWLLDRGLALRKNLSGASFVVPAGILLWAVSRDYNLFLRNEPSLLIIWVYAFVVLAALVAAGRWLCGKVFCKKTTQETATSARTSRKSLLGNVHPGMLVTAVSLLGVCAVAFFGHKNVILSCRMQNMMLDEEWVEIAELPLGEGHVDRSVAAYHEIACTRLNATLERTFEIRYDYPTVTLDNIAGMDEGVNYIAECNLHAGLIQPAYHYALEQTVVAGPRLRYYKVMAIASMLNGEVALCEKILHVIDKMPFQHDFVERVREKLGDVEAQRLDPTLSGILKLAPLENKFEQNYRQPVFLGYSVGVMEGTDATLDVSVAAALYSKDMENIILRAEYLQQKRPLPNTVQQALVLASMRRPGLLDRFPGISDFVKGEVNSFLIEAREYSADKSEEGKARMADALYEKWIGTYMYYYYCGNLNQTVKKKEETSVN